jgi:hypothetical protein
LRFLRMPHSSRFLRRVRGGRMRHPLALSSLRHRRHSERSFARCMRARNAVEESLFDVTFASMSLRGEGGLPALAQVSPPLFLTRIYQVTPESASLRFSEGCVFLSLLNRPRHHIRLSRHAIFGRSPGSSLEKPASNNSERRNPAQQTALFPPVRNPGRERELITDSGGHTRNVS